MEDRITEEEQLLEIVKRVPLEVAAFILQGYVQSYGPVSNEIGEKIKQELKQKQQ